MTEAYDKLIFVCTGNTCRSPMAEAIFRELKLEKKMEVLSRGVVVLFPEPINPKSVYVLENHGMKLEGHTAKPFKMAEVTEQTLVLTMTENLKNKLVSEYGIQKNVYTLKEYVGEFGDVTDPYGGSVIEYEECFGELMRLVKKTGYKLSEV